MAQPDPMEASESVADSPSEDTWDKVLAEEDSTIVENGKEINYFKLIAMIIYGLHLKPAFSVFQILITCVIKIEIS